jgi:hypothetical protein
LVEVGACNVAWDRGLLVKRGIDPIKHAELYFGSASFDYRILCIGSQGTAEYTRGRTWDNPVAVYPTWEYGEDSIILEDMLDNPMGEDEVACNDMSVPPDERPVFGQEHRVVLTALPEASRAQGRAFFRYLKTLQEDYPHVIFHIHGLYSWRFAFGMGFGSADIEPRAAASKGRVHTPAGTTENWERMVSKPQWAAALGFKPSDLSVPRNRCMYNIKSALWAGQNYNELFKFKTRGGGTGDYTSSDKDHVPAVSNGSPITKGKAQDGDKILCDTCSLQNNCKYFRSGAVCSVPGAEPIKLSRMFKTRNADDIIDALGTLASAGASRLERQMQIEEAIGDIDPEVSKMMGQVFDQGVKLAKLVEPGRFSGGAKVQVNVGPGGAASVSASNPRQLVASTVQALVAQGVPREKITAEMIQGALEGMVNPDRQQKAIQGSVLEVKDEEKS